MAATRISSFDQAVFGTAGSSTDANRLYSILLDTRASSASESMYDIAEKLLRNEKDNSKVALDQLWALKKNLTVEQQNGTIEILINFYQEKINILRNKEEYIRKVSKDSRDLLEDKRKRDSEIATVKQEVSDCTTEIDRLQVRLTELRVKEQELTLIEEQLKRELAINANEVVNGLYEIIMSTQGTLESPFSFEREVDIPAAAAPVAQTMAMPPAAPRSSSSLPSGDEMAAAIITDLERAGTQPGRAVFPDISEVSATFSPSAIEPEPVVSTYPKSIVKTTRGVIIGEYYYDPRVYKNERHYIYNSDFFRKKLSQTVTIIDKKFDQTLYAETMQMMLDVQKRVGENPMLHFEVSTNEILNRETLKDLIHSFKMRQMQDVGSFANRLRSKIDFLGANYQILLAEQLERCSADSTGA